MGISESKKGDHQSSHNGHHIKVSELQTYIMVVQLKLTQRRNKKVFDNKKKKDEVVSYLNDGNTEMAKLKTEGILRNEDHMIALDFLGTLCELVKEKITYLLSYDTCPEDLRAPLETLIWASSRVEIEEFHKFRDLIKKKYGEAFVEEAIYNKSGLVNKNIEKQLSILPFNENVVIAKLKEIAKEENVEVDFPEEIIAPVQDFSNPFGVVDNPSAGNKGYASSNSYYNNIDMNMPSKNTGLNSTLNMNFNNGQYPTFNNNFANTDINNTQGGYVYNNINSNFNYPQQPINYTPFPQNSKELNTKKI